MTPFETIVRKHIGDEYDAAFPPRSNEVDAGLTSIEESMVEVLADMYGRAVGLDVEEVQAKVRHALATALKSLRKSAETRKKKADALVKRSSAPLYRYRIIAPDGTEILYPTRGTIHTNRTHALIYRYTPTPTDQIEANVRRYYAHHLGKSQSDDHTAKLHAAIARDIATEIRLQAEKSESGWWLVDFSARRSTIEKTAKRWASKPTDRWQYEHMIVEGTPFILGEN
jgi:hypothetical protein